MKMFCSHPWKLGMMIWRWMNSSFFLAALFVVQIIIVFSIIHLVGYHFVNNNMFLSLHMHMISVLTTSCLHIMRTLESSNGRVNETWGLGYPYPMEWRLMSPWVTRSMSPGAMSHVVPMRHMRPMDPQDHGPDSGPCKIWPGVHGTRDGLRRDICSWIHVHGYGSMSLAHVT